jgi:hypothetical protein
MSFFKVNFNQISDLNPFKNFNFEINLKVKLLECLIYLKLLFIIDK